MRIKEKKEKGKGGKAGKLVVKSRVAGGDDRYKEKRER